MGAAWLHKVAHLALNAPHFPLTVFIRQCSMEQNLCLTKKQCLTPHTSPCCKMSQICSGHICAEKPCRILDFCAFCLARFVSQLFCKAVMQFWCWNLKSLSIGPRVSFHLCAFSFVDEADVWLRQKNLQSFALQRRPLCGKQQSQFASQMLEEVTQTIAPNWERGV